MKLGFIFTDDWELFGNGSGNIEERQIVPAYRFMDISEKYGAKYTFMAEVCQYLSFKKKAKEFPELEKGAKQWEKVLQDAIRRGHDVQLHLHPQWQGAIYENGSWKVNLEYWSLPLLSPEHIRGLVREGKKTLETLLKPIDPNYSCTCFRSGAWLMQPSSTILKILHEEGISCDTSVLPGCKCGNMFGRYNYEDAHSNLFPWWTKENDINQQELSPDKRTVIEMPIYAESKYFPTFYPHILKKFRKRRRWLNEIYPPEDQPGLKVYKQSLLKEYANTLLKLTLGKRTIVFDHGQLSADHMLAMVKRIRKRAKSLNYDGTVPIISITHSKISYFYDEYDKFLRGLREQYGDEVVFLSFSDACKYLHCLASLPRGDLEK